MSTAKFHSLERTSPKGQKFIGTCRLCGKAELTFADMSEPCENVRGLTNEEALIETLDATQDPRSEALKEAIAVAFREMNIFREGGDVDAARGAGHIVRKLELYANAKAEMQPPAGETIRTTQDGSMEAAPETGQSPVGAVSTDAAASYGAICTLCGQTFLLSGPAHICQAKAVQS